MTRLRRGTRHIPERVQRARQRLAQQRVEAGLERVRPVICEPARTRIVLALEEGELSVQDLAEIIDRSPTGTSQHLRILRALDLVAGTRRGTAVYYQLKPTRATAHLRGVLEAADEREAA